MKAVWKRPWCWLRGHVCKEKYQALLHGKSYYRCARCGKLLPKDINPRRPDHRKLHPRSHGNDSTG